MSGLRLGTIQDGNYEDFKRGDQASLLSSFYASAELSAGAAAS